MAFSRPARVRSAPVTGMSTSAFVVVGGSRVAGASGVDSLFVEGGPDWTGVLAFGGLVPGTSVSVGVAEGTEGTGVAVSGGEDGGT